MSAPDAALCVCATCGPPWRATAPEPDKATDLAGWLGWHSWMALCPTCGNKRCPGAANHENACTGSNRVGQAGSLYESVEPRLEVDERGRVHPHIARFRHDVIDDHAPLPGPDYWNWRCLRCGEAVRLHGPWWRRLLNRWRRR